MHIWFPHTSVRVNSDIFESTCPALCQQIHHKSINGKTVSDQVVHLLRKHTRSTVSSTFTQSILIEVIQALPSSSWSAGHDNLELRLWRIIESRIYEDSMSLLQGRRAFLVICAFAKLAESQVLAEPMGNIATERRQLIEQYESSHALKEWGIGLRMLQEVLSNYNGFDGGMFGSWPHADFHDSMVPLMLEPSHLSPFDNYHRGRAPLMLTGPHHFPRARSVPRLRHRRSHGLQLAFPRVSHSAWNSPVLSPMLRSPTPYVDEIGQLQWQQEEMNGKLDDIDHKLSQLMLRW